MILDIKETYTKGQKQYKITKLHFVCKRLDNISNKKKFEYRLEEEGKYVKIKKLQ